MILLGAADLAAIEAAATAAYPAESCGLLVGRRAPAGTIMITRVVKSENLKATERTDRFEVDPKVRFDTMRAVEGTDEAIVGHYHSHPDHPAEPSRTDLEMAWEPEMIWLITAVSDGRAGESKAHVLKKDGAGFQPIPLRITGETGTSTEKA